MNTRPKDTSLGGYFTQSQQGSPIRRVYENNMDEFSFNTVDVSILKTINSTHQAYFDLVSTIKENVKFGCKVWKENIPMYLISPSVIHTLESGIEVGPTVINLAFFSRPYGLIRDYIKVI